MNRIHKEELKSRVGFVMLALWGFYLIDPLKGWLNSIIPPAWRIPIGLAGFLITLYFFEF